MPAGSKTDPPLAKAKPISASVITYLRRRKPLRERELLQPERGVRRCKKLCRHQVKEGSEKAALVGTWPQARVNPPQSLWRPTWGHEKIEIRIIIGRALEIRMKETSDSEFGVDRTGFGLLSTNQSYAG
ncbi:hypothetical protein GRJ2_000711400 [Grus japonensis]|uniref:Uncharacterized protein n=1 Tax=Grus japonensis TaxID=30415 RepID=A0ABC9WAX2_GRUJA